MGECRWCHGTGTQYVERGSSLCYRCPDCDGTGYIQECNICGEEYYGEYCEECYAMCSECGEVAPTEYMTDGLCEDCAADAESESDNKGVEKNG